MVGWHHAYYSNLRYYLDMIVASMISNRSVQARRSAILMINLNLSATLMPIKVNYHNGTEVILRAKTKESDNN